MTPGVKGWLVYLAALVAALGVVYAVAETPRYDDAKARRALHETYDKARRFDRVCTAVATPLRLAQDRIRKVATADAGRDIAVMVAPVVAQCTGLGAHQARLEGLATSNNAAHDIEVIQIVLDEIASAK